MKMKYLEDRKDSFELIGIETNPNFTVGSPVEEILKVCREVKQIFFG